ncbi:MAG: hypothetical protein OHK0015_53280 [Chloroflexi bacterium OHK40]
MRIRLQPADLRDMLLHMVLVLVLLLSMAGCGNVGTPAQRIVGRWEGSFGNAIEFYPNQTFIQTNPSGRRFAGTYSLSEDGKTISSESNGSSTTSPISFEGDTLQIFGAELRRVGDVAIPSRSIAELLVGSWSGEGGTYDFYADGTWASYLGSDVAASGGRYIVSEDGSTLTLQSMKNGEETRPILLVTETTLVMRSPFVFERTAELPTRPFPQGFLNSAGEAAPETIEDVRAGEVRTIGSYSLVLHQARELTFSASMLNALDGTYFAVELSVRNDGTTRLGGPEAWRYAVLSASGERLNEEAIVSFGVAEEFADQLPGDCADSLYATALLPVTRGPLLPGAVLRTWVLFQQTPGLDANELQLEVQVSEAEPGFSFSQPEPIGSITFRLDGSTSMDPLPWQPTRADMGATVGGVAFSEATIGATGEGIAGDPCTAERVVSVRAVNTGAATAVAIPNGGILLLDNLGRIYTTTGTMSTRSMSGEYGLPPREEKTIGFPFPASFGVRDGVVALILIDGDTWYQLPVK